MIKYLVTTIMAMVTLNAVAISFSLPRIKSIAEAMSMKIPEGLGANVNNDSTWTWKKSAVRLCTDRHGIVCHIGYKLFENEFFESYLSSSVLQFLERYLLEQDLKSASMASDFYDHLDDVRIASGRLEYLKGIDRNTPFTIDNIQRKMYKATWGTPRGDVILIFPANCQNILGGNALELEKWVVDRMAIQESYSDKTLLAPWNNANVSQSSTIRIKDYGNYLSPLIDSKIYFVARDGNWKPYCSTNNKVLSIANMMLTGISDHDIPMDILFDQYGKKKDAIHISLRQFVSFCQDEKSKIYLGVKTVNSDTLTGTLFIYNEPLGYNHMLSFSFPINILSGGNEHIAAQLYAYIPLHNVTEIFFNQNLYQNYGKLD